MIGRSSAGKFASSAPPGSAKAAAGQMEWQQNRRHNRRALAEATIGRFKRVIGDGLRSRTDQRQATEMTVAVAILNRMRELGRPKICQHRPNRGP